ncbi:MAG: type III-A CRISPR-associated protein Cas10/Csm1, partial [Candidatus Methanomethylicaceae archaeon]
LMERYTSFIPSITLYIEGASDRESFKKHPDVSLFDHSKVTAAAAVCLYHYYSTNYRDRWNRQVLKDEITAGWSETTQEPFILVGGDLSGVQNFIYTISSSGALKSLKGRSFFLELLTEHLVDMLVERLKLTRCNVLFTGGGHFYLLAANTEDAKKDIERLSHELDEYLWGSYNGSLGCCLAYVSMGKGAFRDTTRSWRELSEKIEFMKRRKWEDRLNKVLGPPESPHSDWLSSQCEVCAREDVPRRVIREVNMCPTCEEQFLFGEELQKACREASRNPGTFVCIGVWEGEASWEGNGVLTISVGRKRSYKPFYSKKNTDRPNGVTWVYRLNDWNVENYKAFGDRPLLAGTYHASEFEDLESLVEQGYGWNRAGVLRMDVDNLGKIFSQWVREEDRTFSRMASLSRQFSLFFKYHLNGILDLRRGDGYESIQRVRLAAKNRGDERLLSIVYSGGDDVFIIGHWLDVLEAAYDIHAAFTAMVGNPNVTLSAGLALAAHHYPIYRFARDAGEAEKKAKKAGRNRLTVFGHFFSWEEMQDIKKIVLKEIIPLLKEETGAFNVAPGSVSRRFFHIVLALIRNFLGGNSRSATQYWILPKMAYMTERLGPSRALLEVDKVSKAWMGLREQLLFYQPSDKHLSKMEAALSWAIMMMKEG